MSQIEHIMALADSFAEYRDHSEYVHARQALRAAIEQALTPGEPVDDRALIRKVDAELEAHGLESYTTVHTSRYRLLTAARHFLSVATGRLPDWLLQPAQALRAATEEGITK